MFISICLIIAFLSSDSDTDFWTCVVGRGEAEAVEVAEAVYRSLKDRPHDWRDCVAWARLQWERFYNYDIAQLLHCFPPDHVLHVHTHTHMLLNIATFKFGVMNKYVESLLY